MINQIILPTLVLAFLVSSSPVTAGACKEGFQSGKRKVQRSWRSLGEDCDNMRRLERLATRMTRRSGVRRGHRTWRNRSYTRCMKDGIEKTVEEYKEECQACEEGFDEGQAVVRQMWRQHDEDCDSIWGLESRAKRLSRRR